MDISKLALATEVLTFLYNSGKLEYEPDSQIFQDLRFDIADIFSEYWDEQE